ncbi:MAG TPA: hypothetical protein VGF13_17350 [Verrucomicrobiae bacterium]|jgi:hypothetical protein
MKKSFPAYLHSLVFSPLAAVLVLAPIVSTRAADSLDFIMDYSSGNYYGGTVRSLGSGVAYWPARNSYLVLDNTIATYTVNGVQVTGPRLVEYFRDNTIDREIVLVGFRDAEDIHCLYGSTFVIAQERHDLDGDGDIDAADSVDQLVTIVLPDTGGDNTTVNFANAVRVATISTDTANGGFVSSAGPEYNKGIEGVAVVGGNFYFTTEKAPSSPANFWKVWTVPLTANGTVIPTVAFDLAGILPAGVTDVSGMASDGVDLWILTDDGKRVIKVSTSGSLLADYQLPTTGGFTWNQPEGIDLFFDTADLRLKILLTGEKDDGAGVDFMLLKASGVKLATVTAGNGWIFYPFLNGGGSQYYVTTTSAINTAGLSGPAPQSVYQRIQPEFSTLTVNGLSPTTLYRVRVHLSSVQFTGYQNVLQDVWVSNGGSPNWVGSVTPYGSGGFNQAMIVDLGTMYPSYPGYSGVFFVGISPSAAGKTVVVNGIEIWPVP